MSAQIPRLMYSVMTRRVYLVTRYKDNGNGHIVAHTKRDVTEEFDEVCRHRMLDGDNHWHEVSDMLERLAESCGRGK